MVTKLMLWNQFDGFQQDPYMLNKLNTSNSHDTISLLYRNHQIDATTLIWPPFVIPNNMQFVPLTIKT